MWKGQRAWAARYGLAVLVTALALLARAPLFPLLQRTAPYLTFIPAVMVAGYLGGWGPGLLATLLSALCAELFLIGPGFSLSHTGVADSSALVAFLLTGALMSWLTELLHRARRGAESSEQRLRVTLRSIADGVIVCDTQGKVRFLNPVGEGLTGWSEAGAAGRPLGEVFTVFHEDTGSPAATPAGRLSWTPEEATLGHLVLRSRTGEMTPIEDSAAPIRDDAGKPAGMVLVFRDSSERKKALRTLQRAQASTAESLAQLDSLLTHAPLGFACFDRRFQATRVNRFLADLAALEPLQLVGRRADRVLPFDPDLTHNLLARALERGEESLDRELSSGAGPTLRFWLASFYPVRPSGRTVELVGVVLVEMTERKRLEAELRRQAAELAEADRRKDLFLATLSHELRAPLAPIRTSCQTLALRQAVDPLGAELGRVIERQAGQLSRLVEDLLDTARISRGLITLRCEPIDLAPLAQRAAEAVRPLLLERDHRLDLLGIEPDLRLIADPARLVQVLTNLLTNAARYTPPGGRIELAARADGDSVAIRVADNGLGISADLLPTLFEPFNRGSRGPELGEEGLGLGLTLVRGVVEMHGGTVSAHSDGPGRGSTFLVRMPRRPGSALRPSAHPDASPAPATAPGRPRRILVVDDCSDAAESLALLLRFKGYEVTIAGDGHDALDRSATFAPDLVILDVNLPGGFDGLEVARRLRAGPGGSNLRLVALTGLSHEDDKRRSREAGFDFHFIKPVSFEDLAEALG